MHYIQNVNRLLRLMIEREKRDTNILKYSQARYIFETNGRTIDLKLYIVNFLL